MNNTYTFVFTHLTTMKLDGFLVDRCMVNSKEKVNNEYMIDTMFDIRFTPKDVQTLPLDGLKTYFETNPKELFDRIAFSEWKNASSEDDEKIIKTIIHALLKSEVMESVFEDMEYIFESFRFCQEEIKNLNYSIKPLSKNEIEVIIDGEYGEERFLVETEGEGTDAYVSYFAFFVDGETEPVAIFDFLPQEVEKAFFDDVLNKIAHKNEDNE